MIFSDYHGTAENIFTEYDVHFAISIGIFDAMMLAINPYSAGILLYNFFQYQGIINVLVSSLRFI